MVDFLESTSELVTDWSIQITFALVVGVVLLIIMNRKTQSPAPLAADTNRCSSPSCARCHRESQIQKELLGRLEKHVADNFSVQPQDITTYLSQNYARILSTIDSYDHKTEVLSSIYSESGHSDVSVQNLAHVWMMPGLSRRPLWSAKDHTLMEKLFSVFEDSKNFESILQEYMAVSELEVEWKANFIQSGSWKTYFLMNQGDWNQEKSARCPQTVRLLESIGCLMKGMVFGNVVLSSLKPGSQIEPHTSPCNFRLRCHLALKASDGFCLNVGKHTTTWQAGKLLVFDDSFVHSVCHKSHSDSDNNPEEERVVLIFDVWHPDLNDTEQQALKDLFE